MLLSGMHLFIVPLHFFSSSLFFQTISFLKVISETQNEISLLVLGTDKKSRFLLCFFLFRLRQMLFCVCVDVCQSRLPHRCPSKMLVTAWSSEGPDVALVGAAEGPCRR